MTTAAAKRDLHPTVCGGDGCNARDPWPLHNVRHRGVFCSLCTSCVLKYHPGSFCSCCFDVLDASQAGHRPVVHCSKCPSVSHLACLPNPDLASQFVCPVCKNPDDFSYFDLPEVPNEKAGDGPQLEIDRASAKVLLAASRLAAASMSRAAAVARTDAERKVKEAAVARKRAREMLERALTISKKEKDKMQESIETALAPVPEVVEPKKKMPRPSSTVAAAMSVQRRVQKREREKLMRFHEPISAVQRPVQGIAENDKSKGASDVDVNGRLGSITNLPNNSGQEEKDKKGVFLGSQVKEEVKGSMADSNKSPRIPQSTQGIILIFEAMLGFGESRV